MKFIVTLVKDIVFEIIYEKKCSLLFVFPVFSFLPPAYFLRIKPADYKV